MPAAREEGRRAARWSVVREAGEHFEPSLTRAGADETSLMVESAA
jgi:hypothetical protein